LTTNVKNGAFFRIHRPLETGQWRQALVSRVMGCPGKLARKCLHVNPGIIDPAPWGLRLHRTCFKFIWGRGELPLRPDPRKPPERRPARPIPEIRLAVRLGPRLCRSNVRPQFWCPDDPVPWGPSLFAPPAPGCDNWHNDIIPEGARQAADQNNTGRGDFLAP